MTKKEKYQKLLCRLTAKERDIFLSLPKKAIDRMITVEKDIEVLLVAFKNLVESNAIDIKRKQQQQKQQQQKQQQQKQQQQKQQQQQIESVEPVEIPIPRIGVIEIDIQTFRFFCSIFNFSPTEAKKRIYNLYVYHPSRCPLVGLGIHIPDPKELFYHAIAEYSIGNGGGYQYFVACFSKEVYNFLKLIGNKTIRRKTTKNLSGPCIVYRAGKIVSTIPPRDQEYDHVAVKMISWDPL